MASGFRRTTMGPLSSSAINTRQSLGGAGRFPGAAPGAAPRKTSMGFPAGRPSLAPGAMIPTALPVGGAQVGAAAPRKNSAGGSRRSSMFGGNTKASSSSSRQDPRDVMNKVFQRNAATVIIEYIASHGYDHPIAPKMLQSPTQREFYQMFQFLYRQIDPAYTLPQQKLDEEITTIFRRLRYPFAISKHALQAVGSPHTWPSILGALHWLVELLQYEEAAAIEERESGTDSPERLFFDYVTKAYELFLSGQDDFEPLDRQLAAAFDQKHGDTSAQLQRLTQEVDQMEAQLHQAHTEPSPLEQMERKKSDLEADLVKFHKLIDSFTTHKASLEKHLEGHRAELLQKEQELAQDLHDNQLLQQRVDSQQMTPVDVQRLQQQRQMLAEAVAQLTQQREQDQELISEISLAISKKTEEIGSSLQQYNKAVAAMRMVPASAENAAGVSFALAFNPEAQHGDALFLPPVEGKLRKDVARAKEAFLQRVREGEIAMRRAKSRLDEHEELFADRCAQISALDAKMRAIDQRYEDDRAQMAEQLRDIQLRTESEEQVLQQLSLGTGEELGVLQRTLELKHSEFEELARAAQQQQEMVRAGIAETMQMLASHKRHIRDQLRELELLHTRVLAATKQTTAN
eukprot:TRINITY_DN2458_c0_g1_i1.p1 TRINITY_DN2458_c0_g1~~TRINITY_DN2458_c0_g1_i1.p1  ORF type:complete len:630 (-),score=148.24 TRINITY_DN2458_c0_g1_i1:5-1894(-)